MSPNGTVEAMAVGGSIPPPRVRRTRLAIKLGALGLGLVVALGAGYGVSSWLEEKRSAEADKKLVEALAHVHRADVVVLRAIDAHPEIYGETARITAALSMSDPQREESVFHTLDAELVALGCFGAPSGARPSGSAFTNACPAAPRVSADGYLPAWAIATATVLDARARAHQCEGSRVHQAVLHALLR